MDKGGSGAAGAVGESPGGAGVGGEPEADDHDGPAGDQLRRAGWRGQGPVPWSHEPNRGFLRSLAALGRAAAEIGEDDEAVRCREFLDGCDPAAAEELGLS